MTGIAGIGESGRVEDVGGMLDKIGHRGPNGREIIEVEGATLGVVWSETEKHWIPNMRRQKTVWDAAGRGHFARVDMSSNRLTLTRDDIGVVPLYYGRISDGALCFGSEVKALLTVTRDINELPPATCFDGVHQVRAHSIKAKIPLDLSAARVANGLRKRIAESVKTRVGERESVGALLSGGLDSSIMSVLSGQCVEELHTFAAGVPDADDLGAAKEVANFIGSNHHDVIVTLDDMIKALPEVIYHLESFDALLVRSSIMHYIVSREASRHVDAVFSGEGADELFAGYEYIKSMKPEAIAAEVVDATRRLHNTALQRVDRCSSAHSITAFVGFLDPSVVKYSLRIPARMKVFEGVEKWILRAAMKGRLPERILNRTKSKFWQGAGVGDKLAEVAESTINDEEFRRERKLSNGWTLNTKEELLYYRIFREHFGDFDKLSWMGRTKGAPRRP